MLAWLGTGLASLLVVTAALCRWYLWQRKQEAVRIVNAIAAGDCEELSILLAERMNFLSVAAWFGDPALIIAVKSNRSVCGVDFTLEALRLLLSRGADIDARGIDWKTALMHAAAGGYREICEFLLSHGADPDARDLFGRTAAYWAMSGGHERVACLLRNSER